MVLGIILQQKQGKNTRKTKMIAGEKQTNRENQKKNVPKGHILSPAPKNKTEISNSFLQRIISLLRKEELI